MRITRRLWAAFFIVCTASLAWAAGEMAPSGNPVLDTALQARLLVKSDTVPVPANRTRAIYIGDAAACTASLVLSNDLLAAPVTFANLQPGREYKLSVKYLMSTTTTCTAVIALY